MFLAALLYSVGGLCIKVIPWGGMAINGGRTAIALVVIGTYLAVTRHRLKLNRWVLLGALAVFGTNAFFSLANKMTTAANAIVLQFTAPIFVIVFSGVFFRRRPDKLDLGACAAVFGGIGSIPGAVVGGFVIGICETLLVAMGYSTFSDAFTFLLLIVMLLFRPTGLFGEKSTDKV